MKQENVIRIAKQVGFPIHHPEWQSAVQEFAALVEQEAAAHKREACAQIADEWSVGYPHPSTIIATAIRARGE